MPSSPSASQSPGLRMAWSLAVLAHVCWGFLAPGAKLLLEWWPEWTLNATRMAIATLVLMVWYGRSETVYGLKALLVDKHLAILGIVGIGLTFGLYVASLNYIEATAAAVLIFLAPFFTAALARLVIKEPAGWHLLAAALVTLVGAYLALFGVTLDALATLGPGSAWGLGINLVSVVLWAVYTVHLRVVAPRYPLGRLTIATFFAATVFFALNAAVFERGDLDVPGALTPVALLYMALYVAFPSVAAYLLYAASIGRVGAGPITILLGVELLVTSVIAHLLLNERFPPARVWGLVLTTAAVVWFVWMQSRYVRRLEGGVSSPTL